MFDRIKYKNFAKVQLKGRYKVPVLMCLFSVFIMGLLLLPSFALELVSPGVDFSYETLNLRLFAQTVQSNFFTNSLDFISWLIFCVITCASLFVYIKMSKSPEPVKFGDFIEGFSLWGRGILASLWRGLWIYLWTLLFIIPGIVKSYAYSMQLFLITEYQNLSILDALKISMKITNGHKWDLFILDLSFLGWRILSCLTCGILFFYVEPYYLMTRVNAYHALLKEAVEKGIITKEDLSI